MLEVAPDDMVLGFDALRMKYISFICCLQSPVLVKDSACPGWQSRSLCEGGATDLGELQGMLCIHQLSMHSGNRNLSSTKHAELVYTRSSQRACIKCLHIAYQHSQIQWVANFHHCNLKSSRQEGDCILGLEGDIKKEMIALTSYDYFVTRDDCFRKLVSELYKPAS